MHGIGPASPHAHLIPSLGVEDQRASLFGGACPCSLLVRLRPAGGIAKGEALTIPEGMASLGLFQGRLGVYHPVAAQANKDIAFSPQRIHKGRLAVSAIGQSQNPPRRCWIHLQESAHLLAAYLFRVLLGAHPLDAEEGRPRRVLGLCLLGQIGQQGVEVAYGNRLLPGNRGGAVDISPVLHTPGIRTWMRCSVHAEKVELALVGLGNLRHIQAQKGAFRESECPHSLV